MNLLIQIFGTLFKGFTWKKSIAPRRHAGEGGEASKGSSSSTGNRTLFKSRRTPPRQSSPISSKTTTSRPAIVATFNDPAVPLPCLRDKTSDAKTVSVTSEPVPPIEPSLSPPSPPLLHLKKNSFILVYINYTWTISMKIHFF